MGKITICYFFIIAVLTQQTAQFWLIQSTSQVAINTPKIKSIIDIYMHTNVPVSALFWKDEILNIPIKIIK